MISQNYIQECKDDITNLMLDKSEFVVALPSTGGIPQTSWFIDSMLCLVRDCFTNVDLFEEDEIEGLLRAFDNSMFIYNYDRN